MFVVTRVNILKDVINRSNVIKCKQYSGVRIPIIKAGVRNPYVNDDKSKTADINLEARHVYPEFLPDPDYRFRHYLREKIERSDMLKRRANIELPEFYVGSILAVTSSNIHAPTKTTRFVGICTVREGCGLRATFTLRNTVDNQGMEMRYNLYDPQIQKIEVLRLEKRLDKDLRYLVDAEPEYTTFPFDMEPEYLAEGEPVPVNPVKVKLKPLPWKARYEIKGYVGIQKYELPEIRWELASRVQKMDEEYQRNDLMAIYRRTIPEEEQRQIYAEVLSEIQKYEIKRRKIKRRSEFVPPKKSA